MADLTDADVIESGTFDLWEFMPDKARIGVTIDGVYKETTLENLRKQLTVVSANQAPTVTISAISQGIELGEAAIIMADAADSDGTIVRLVLQDFSTQVAEATGTNRTNFSVTPTTIGTHVYSVIAFDNAGASGQSTAIPVVVRAAGQVKPGPPTNVVAAVVNGSIVVNATPPAAAGTSPVAGYQVFVNGQGYPSFTNVALPFTVPNAVAGTAYYYQLEANSLAGDSAKSTQSNTVTIPVVANTPPVVTDFAASATALTTGQSLTFTASATDSDGTVTSVRIYEGNAVVATIAGASGTSPAITPGTGGHTYSAKAVDNTGAEGAAFGTTRTVAVTAVAPSYNTTVNSVNPTADVVSFAGLTNVDFKFNAPLPTGDPGPFTMSIFLNGTQLAQIDATPACAGVACAVVYQGTTYQTTFQNGTVNL